jgi:hypothetical protein
MSLGMTLIRANTLAFGLIGKDGQHRIIKICFRNMNLVFGSEVGLLGFWEYLFGIFFRVFAQVLQKTALPLCTGPPKDGLHNFQ